MTQVFGESLFNEKVTAFAGVETTDVITKTVTSQDLSSSGSSNLNNLNVTGVTTTTNLSAQSLSVSGLSAQSLSVSGVSTFIGISTFNKIDVKAAVETVSVASTYQNTPFNNVILECDADLGTIFTHNIGSNGTVGIVSFKNFPTLKNSATSYTIIFTQQSTTPSGTGNTTASTGIGTNVFLKPTNVTGFTTSAKVGYALTITLSPVANDVDIVSFMIHYNGGSTGIASNYMVYINSNGFLRYGTIKP